MSPEETCVIDYKYFAIISNRQGTKFSDESPLAGKEAAMGLDLLEGLASLLVFLASSAFNFTSWAAFLLPLCRL